MLSETISFLAHSHNNTMYRYIVRHHHHESLTIHVHPCVFLIGLVASPNTSLTSSHGLVLMYASIMHHAAVAPYIVMKQ